MFRFNLEWGGLSCWSVEALGGGLNLIIEVCFTQSSLVFGLGRLDV